MIENVLTQKKVSLQFKIAIKTLISTSIIAMAVFLPQIVHIFVGASGGVKLLPMYLPVLLGGCLLGVTWGVGIGILAPIISYLITLIIGAPMPTLDRLPFMVVELAVIALVCGLFSKKIMKNSLFAFLAILLSFIAGRSVFMILVCIFQSVSTLAISVVWRQIQSGFLAVIIQSLIVPVFVIGFKYLISKDNK